MKLQTTLLAWIGMLVALAYVAASPVEVTTTAVAVRPSGAVGEHIDPNIVKRLSFGFWFKQLVLWGASAVACSPPFVLPNWGWACIYTVIYSISETTADLMRAGAREGSAAFRNMHTQYYPPIDGLSTLQQLKAGYDGGEPILALSCNSPGSPGCANNNYSNRMHTDDKRTIHRFQVQVKGSKVAKRQEVNTVTEGIDSDDPDSAPDVWGSYDFMGDDADAEKELGNEVNFEHDSTEKIAEKGEDTFNQKGAWCVNLQLIGSGWSTSETTRATVGFLVVNDNEHAPVEETAWMVQCNEGGE